MIDVNIMKQYIGTGLKCHLIGEDIDEYPDHAPPKEFTFVGIRQHLGGTIMCRFEETPNWTWEIDDVIPILHPLPDLNGKIMYEGKLIDPSTLLTYGLISAAYTLYGIIKARINSNSLSHVDAQALYRMGFDLDGLIDSKDAVDVNTL